jgi:3-oxoacyl-[acyl-carrier protein] reductase
MSETKRVLVTGASSEIGKMILKELVSSGYEVDFIHHRNALSDSLLAELEDCDGTIGKGLLCDLGDPDAVEGLVQTLRLSSNHYYGFIHNAGIAYDCLVAHADMNRARSLMEVNFWSFAALCKALLPAMCRQRSGRVVAIGSIAAFSGKRGNGFYSASKAAITGLVKTLAAEVAPRGVTVNAVLPGPVDTHMLAKYPEQIELLKKRVPLGRLAEPREIASLVRFLMAPEAGFITGSLQVIDGGLTSCLAN